MYWTVRGVLEDRPGALAALAAGCGKQNLNILGLQIFPSADGRVVDELVVQTSRAVTTDDVEGVCRRAGLQDILVRVASAHALADQPVRYLRAAAVAVREPHRLKEQLAVLGHTPGGAGSETELARADAFTDLVAGAMPSPLAAAREAARNPAREVDPSRLVLREGAGEDACELIALHQRCSADTLYRRYHPAAMTDLTVPHTRQLLQPAGGRSLVFTDGDQVVAHGVLAPGHAGLELGLLVEDRWRRLGLGARLLQVLAHHAARTGHESLTCRVQADDRAMLALVHRVGLRARVRTEGNLVCITLSLATGGRDGQPRVPHNRPDHGRHSPAGPLRQRLELR